MFRNIKVLRTINILCVLVLLVSIYYITFIGISVSIIMLLYYLHKIRKLKVDILEHELRKVFEDLPDEKELVRRLDEIQRKMDDNSLYSETDINKKIEHDC